MISFAREAKIRHLIEQVKGTILAVNYTQDVALEIELAVADKDEFCRRAIEETSGDARIQDNEH